MLHESCIQGEIPLQSCKLLSISQELGCNQTHFQIAWYAYKSGTTTSKGCGTLLAKGIISRLREHYDLS